jgi:hypothetical protein
MQCGVAHGPQSCVMLCTQCPHGRLLGLTAGKRGAGHRGWAPVFTISQWYVCVCAVCQHTPLAPGGGPPQRRGAHPACLLCACTVCAPDTGRGHACQVAPAGVPGSVPVPGSAHGWAVPHCLPPGHRLPRLRYLRRRLGHGAPGQHVGGGGGAGAGDLPVAAGAGGGVPEGQRVVVGCVLPQVPRQAPVRRRRRAVRVSHTYCDQVRALVG